MKSPAMQEDEFYSSEGGTPERTGPLTPKPTVDAVENRQQTWLYVVLATCIIMLMITYLIPFFIERIQYALVRGRQRAEVEIATTALNNIQLDHLSAAYQLISKKVGPSVVHIQTRGSQAVRSPHDEFFGRPGHNLPTQGQGSGVIVDEGGFIITNYHVVRNANMIQVSFSDRPPQIATLVGIDQLTDLAVLQVREDDLTVAEWGDSDTLQVGSLVWAMGSPFGLNHSVTSGILSAKNRKGLASLQQSFLQTDAAVNPGNSGGPLVSDQGQVIGINTAIVGESYRGVSFAIPSNIAREVFEKVKKNGYFPRGWLGVELDEVSSARAQQAGVETQQGAFVAKVLYGNRIPAPAHDAGVLAGDVIIKWGDHEIDGPITLSRQVAQTEIGSQVEIIILRKGVTKTLVVNVGQRPDQL